MKTKLSSLGLAICTLFLISCGDKESTQQKQPVTSQPVIQLGEQAIKPIFIPQVAKVESAISIPSTQDIQPTTSTKEQTQNKGNLQTWFVNQAAKSGLKVNWLARGTYLLNEQEQNMLDGAPIGQLVFAITTKMTFSNSYVAATWPNVNPEIPFPHPIFAFSPICNDTLYVIELNSEQELKDIMTTGPLKNCRMLDMNAGMNMTNSPPVNTNNRQPNILK